MHQIEVFRLAESWCWRIADPRGKTVAEAPDVYASRESARSAAKRVRTVFGRVCWQVVEVVNA